MDQEKAWQNDLAREKRKPLPSFLNEGIEPLNEDLTDEEQAQELEGEKAKTIQKIRGMGQKNQGGISQMISTDNLFKRFSLEGFAEKMSMSHVLKTLLSPLRLIKFFLTTPLGIIILKFIFIAGVILFVCVLIISLAQELGCGDVLGKFLIELFTSYTCPEV